MIYDNILNVIMLEMRLIKNDLNLKKLLDRDNEITFKCLQDIMA